MICKQCGADNADSCAYCVGCGASLAAERKKRRALHAGSSGPLSKPAVWLAIAAVVLAAALVVYLAVH